MRTERKSNLLAVLGLMMAMGLAAAEAFAAGPRPLFQMPVPCGQTWRASTYEAHWNGDQDAIDLAQRDEDQTNLSDGEFAIAAFAGTVLQLGTTNALGHNVSLDHGNGWRTDYVHLESLPPLAVGQQIAQGQAVGRVSNSGAAEPHLHYNQRADNSLVRVSFNGNLIDTHAGYEDSWGTWGSDDAEELTSVNCPGGTFAAFTLDGDRYQILYKPRTGEVKFLRLDADGMGTTTVWSGDWGRQWTHIIPFTLSGGQRHLFRYQSSTGEVRFDRIDDDGEGSTTISSGTWWAGWTHFTPFAMGSQPYFIAYDSLNGYANIDRINAAGTGSTTISGSTWTKGWTHFVPYDLGSTQYLLLYKGGSGQVEVNSITESGNSLSVTEVWADTWSTGWSHLVALAHEGTMSLFAYKQSTGAVSYNRLNANGQGTQNLGNTTWTTNWTSFTPVQLPGGAGGLFLYGAAIGDAQVRQLNAAGSGSSSIWSSSSWTTGWR